MPKLVRTARGDSRVGKPFRTPGAPGCIYAPLRIRDVARMALDAFGKRRGWSDLLVLAVLALALVGLVVAVGPEVARP